MNKTILTSIILFAIGIFVGTLLGKDNSHENMGHSMSMDQMMMDMNAELVGKTGAEFDAAFLEQMIIHHEGAVDMAELALENAEMQEIKDLAQDIITTQTQEIEMMNEWKMNLQ